MADNFYNPRTHSAFAYKREGPRLKFGRWVEIGNGRIEQPRCPNCGAHPAGSKGHVFLDRLPIGGFSGYVLLGQFGTKPPLPTPQQIQLIEQGGKDNDDDSEERSET
jgi:hypothetical protein